MPVQVPEFKTVNYGNILGNVEALKGARLRNQALSMGIQEQQNIIAQREKARQIREQIDGMPAQIAALEQAGMFDEADQVRRSYLTTRVNGINMVKSLRSTVDETNWRDFRADMINSGAMDASVMPKEYNPSWFKDQEEKQLGDLKTITRQWGDNGRVMAQDIVFQDGQRLWEGAPYETEGSQSERRLRDSANRPDRDSNMSAADSNSIRAASAELYGGFWDPETGQYRGLSKDLAQQVASVAEEAAKIYRQNGGRLSHLEAVAQAARTKGIDIQQLTNPDDPLGFRQ